MKPLGHFDCAQCGQKHPVYRDPVQKNRLLLPTTCSKEIPNEPTPDQSTEIEDIEENMDELTKEVFSLVGQKHWNEALLKIDDLFVEQNNLYKLVCLIRGDKK